MSSRTFVYSGGRPYEPLVWEALGNPEPDSPPASHSASPPGRPPAAETPPEQPAVLAEHLKLLQEKARQAEEQAQRRVDEAFQKGRQEGLEAGRAEGRAEIQPVIERLAQAIQETAALRPRLKRESEIDLVKLSVAIARRILHREITIDPDALQALTRVMLERLAAQEISRVRVHPQLEPLLRRHCGKRAGAPVEIVADRSLEVGGLIFETERGKLDASVETQLEEIERGLTDRIG